MVWFLIAFSLAGADLLIKHLINRKKDDFQPKEVFGGFATVTRFKNKGAMLGFLKNKGRLLLAVTLICIGFLAGILTAVCGQKGNPLLKSGLTLLIGGAASNAYERFTKGEVTDYIRFNAGPEKFKKIIFNIGDFFIFAGSVLTVIGAVFKKS